MCSTPCFSKNYYVSSSSGDDSNDGLTAETALKTLRKIATIPYLSGDSILLKRGDKWNEILKVQRSGSQGNPITVDGYGTGDKPRITGITNIAPSSWEKVSNTGVYTTRIDRPYGLYEDGHKIIDDNRYNIADGNYTPGNSSLTGSGGDWYFESGSFSLYYKPTSGLPNDHTVQYSTQSSGVYIESQSYIVIKNLNISYIGGSAIYVNSSDHIVVNNCDITYTFEHGIQFRNSRGYNIAINNTITQVGDGIYWTENNTGPNLAINNTISYCNYVVGGSQYNNNDGHAIGMQNGDRYIVRNNTVSYTNMPAILIWVGPGNTGKDCVIKDNIVLASKKATYLKSYYGGGIGLYSADSGALTGGKLYRNIIKTCIVGLKIFNSHTPGPKIFNNTIYSCKEGFHLKEADNWVLKNNIVSHTENHQIYEENSLVGTNNTFNHNLYFPDVSNGWVYRGNQLSPFKKWQSISKQDSDSIIVDPLFKNTIVNDFTLKFDSPAIDSGTWLTTITSPSGAGSSFMVADGSYFYDGYNIPGETGEIIKSESGQIATIVNVMGNKITVNRTIRWTSGEGLALNYEGAAPDMGAYESILSSHLSPPNGFRLGEHNK